MEFYTEELDFSDQIEQTDRGTIDQLVRGISKKMPSRPRITLSIGNVPIVRNFEKLYSLAGLDIPADKKVLFANRNLFSIAHCISATRERDNARIRELQYRALIQDVDFAQTVEMIPSTRYQEFLKAGTDIECAISASGTASAEIPQALTASLKGTPYELGGGASIKLSVSPFFIGKFAWTCKRLEVISAGISSDTCSWVLKPDQKNALLLGDHVLIQIVSVPRNIEKLKYQIQGTACINPGLLKKDYWKSTKKYNIEVPLD